jgi:hypothetical protein
MSLVVPLWLGRVGLEGGGQDESGGTKGVKVVSVRADGDAGEFFDG